MGIPRGKIMQKAGEPLYPVPPLAWPRSGARVVACHLSAYRLPSDGLL